MIVSDLTEPQIDRRLRGDGLRLRSGPFVLRLKSRAPALAAYLRLLYPAHPLVESPLTDVADFHVELAVGGGLRRWWRPTVHFLIDATAPMAPFPRDHAAPLLEWGWNWCIASRAHRFLLLHAAVVAKDDRAVILPGTPGCGKSTLCAALVSRGWRGFSDEFALVRPEDGLVLPLARPITLKNEAINVIRRFSPEAVLGPEFPRTKKGTVAHLRPSAESVAGMARPAVARWIVCPSFQAGAPLHLQSIPDDVAFLRVAANSFNYEVLGERGFDGVTRLIRGARAFQMVHGDLEEAVGALDRLVEKEGAP